MQVLFNGIEKHKQLIYDAEKFIWEHPETGYKEFETSKYLEEQFTKLGYEIVKAKDITGFYARIDTGRPGPELLILGELDSVICHNHPECNKTTGAVHSCGHHAQTATLLGIAAALKEDGALDDMCGRIRLCAVPAEELLEIEYRENLINKGIIKYMGGKSEFLSRGMFDGVDLAFMVHTAGRFGVRRGGNVGCMAKRIVYKGVAAHAGGSPWEGKNALYAATLGLNAINSIRETFKEADLIRVHPIITDGGSMVNAIPEKVVLESYVRGKTFAGIKEANEKVNRALIGSALSLGANIEIIDTPGYAPLTHDTNLIDVASKALKIACPDLELAIYEGTSTGSTDMGDLSCVMPVIHPYCAGATGTDHGKDYKVVDVDSACIKNAKWQLAMAYILLSNNAEIAKKVIAESKPLFSSKEEYLSYIDAINSKGDRITYNEDGTATLKL